MNALAWIALFFAGIAFLWIKEYPRRGKGRLPPGPFSWPFIGNMGVLGRRGLPHQTFQNLSREYGPLVSLKFGRFVAIIVSSAELAKEVLKIQDDVFANRPIGFAGEIIGYKRQDLAWADVGPRWRLLRKVTQFELLSNARIATFQEMRSEELLVTLQEILEESKSNGVVDLERKLGDFTLNNITRMMFGRRYFGVIAGKSSESEEMQRVIRLLSEAVGSYPPGQYFPLLKWLDIGGLEAKMWTAYRNLDAFLSALLEEHRAITRDGDQNEAQDIMNAMLALTGPDQLNDDTIKATCMDMIVGGTDTSANTLLWTMAELMRHPDTMERAQKEVRTVVGLERLVEESDIPNLPYLQAVVKESMRLHPVGPVLAHSAIEATELAGYSIPKESRVLVNAYAIQRDPAYWDNPLDFDPSRFSYDRHSITKPDQEFTLLPFGYGKRSCPGKYLGVCVIQFTLARLLHSFDWTLPPGLTPADVDIRERIGGGLTLPPMNPIKLAATPRLPLKLFQI